MTERKSTNNIYLAGGCFWGVEKLFDSIPGVIHATCGYANGDDGVVPTYSTIGFTHFKETVKVEYDCNLLNLPLLLHAFFQVIDPTVENRQGFDVGSQYQTGIYFEDSDSAAAVNKYVEAIKGDFHDFKVEIGYLISFHPAEDYHQKYLQNNPNGYCHISPKKIDSILKEIQRGFENSENAEGISEDSSR